MGTILEQGNVSEQSGNGGGGNNVAHRNNNAGNGNSVIGRNNVNGSEWWNNVAGQNVNTRTVVTHVDGSGGECGMVVNQPERITPVGNVENGM